MKNWSTSDQLKVALTDGDVRHVADGTRPVEILAEGTVSSDGICVALVDRMPVPLTRPLHRDVRLEFVGIEHIEGLRAYRRSLCLVLIRALADLFPEETLRVEHALQSGYYCHISRPLSKDEISSVRSRVWEIIHSDLPIVLREMHVDEALVAFGRSGDTDKIRLLRYLATSTVELVELDGHLDYFYGPLLPSTGTLGTFELTNHPPGFLLRFPQPTDPPTVAPLVQQPRLLQMLRDQERWGALLGIETVGQLNEVIASGDLHELIHIAEALQEKRVARMADHIVSLRPQPRVVLIAGPSSSGKTTFAKRVSTHLRLNGCPVKSLELDNYFVDRKDNPRDENGEYDFESPDALDLTLLDQHLSALLRGETIELPHYSFREGRKEFRGDTMQLGPDSVLVLEGIHALNPRLSPSVPKELKFEIYISALTQLNIDHHNRVPTTNVRLIRRIVRDHRYRGYTASETLKRWGSVRRGEERHIFPFQESAQVMFNSALLYELAVLKTFAEPLLRQITPDDENYPEARRMLRFLSFFLPITRDLVPLTSLLREFVGGGSIQY